MPVSDKIKNENGNILIILLMAVVLLGVLTMVISSKESGNKAIDDEQISLSINKIQTMSSQIAMGVDKLIRNGISETDIRFSHDKLNPDYGVAGGSDSNAEVFHLDGGQISYQSPPKGINDGSEWEFMAHTALPDLGDNSYSELVAILPNITDKYCDAINTRLGYDISVIYPEDTGACIYDQTQRFSASNQYNDSSPNTINSASVKYPFMEGCIKCSDKNHYIKVLLVR